MVGMALQRLAWQLGYFVRRMPARRRHNRAFDAYDDQALLLGTRSPLVIFDVGANVGATVRRYASLFPNSIIHAFEPLPDTFAQLQGAVRDEPRIHAHDLALADSDGRRVFYVNKRSETNSLLRVAESYNQKYANSDATQPVGEVTVRTTTIDSFCAQGGIEHIDILKLDIQGGELMALRGAGGMLGRVGVDLIYSEILFAKTYEGQAYFHQLSAYLTELGYVLLDLYPMTYTRNGFASWADAIWLSPKLDARMNRCP